VYALSIPKEKTHTKALRAAKSQQISTRTRTRTNTNPNDTEANAAGSKFHHICGLVISSSQEAFYDLMRIFALVFYPGHLLESLKYSVRSTSNYPMESSF